MSIFEPAELMMLYKDSQIPDLFNIRLQDDDVQDFDTSSIIRK